jgi:hypothetical protein
MERDDLTSRQQDYAIFLPAISGFYATFVGKQREMAYVDPARLPKDFENGVEGINFLNQDQGYFTYKWGLYSGGHANLDLAKADASENMVRNRDRANTLILGDSGGFQIAKGLWEGEWRDPTSPAVQQKIRQLAAQGKITSVNAKGKTVEVDPLKEYQSRLDAAQKKREAVIKWLDGIADYGMTLDIPTWVVKDKKAAAACGVTTHQEAVEATKYNNEYFINNRKGVHKGGTRILNVLQGFTHDEAEDWYQTMKRYCDPKIYPENHFNGWAMGGQNMCDIHLVLKRLVHIRFDGLLEPGVHDWMHFLGTSRLEWACVLTDIQRAVRRYHNPNFTISFDCASPFLATANGQIYIHNSMEDRSKWVYRMQPSVDDKKYSQDTRRFRDAVLQDGVFDNFMESPITRRTEIRDVCIYAPGDLNKIGKEGATSWDSFSYAIQMAHNVWMHINAVQEANRQYDAGSVPNMLVEEQHDRVYFRDLVDQIFRIDNREEALKFVDDHELFWMNVVGTRGNVGKKALNSHANFNRLFSFGDEPADESDTDEDSLDQSKLDQLEDQSDV